MKPYSQTHICKICVSEYEARSGASKYCDLCRYSARLIVARPSKRRWNNSPVGRASRVVWAKSGGNLYQNQYKQSEEGRAKRNARRRDYRQTEKGREVQRCDDRKRMHRRNVQRRGIPCDQYIVIRENIQDYRCYSCGRQAEQVDHVLPVAMARIFGLVEVVDDYVAPICKACHKLKSVQDSSDISRLKKEFAVQGG